MLTLKKLAELTKRNHFSDYLPYLAYDEEAKFYYNQDDTIGYIYEVVPHSFTDQTTINMLKSLLSIVPDDTVVQFILYADPYIQPLLELYKSLKKRQYDIINLATERFAEFWIKGANSGIKQAADIPARFFRSFITIKFPHKKVKNFDLDAFKHNVNEILSGARLAPRIAPPDELLDILRRLFNDRILVGRGYNDLESLSKQIILSETEIRAEFSSLRIGKKIFKCTTPKLFPGGKDGINAFVANQLIGGIWGVASDSEQITTPFIYTLNVYKNDTAIKKEITFKANLVLQQQGFGSLAPSLARKKEEFVWAIDQLDNNTRFVKVLPIIWVYAYDNDTAYQSIARVKRIWEEHGFTMQEDKGILPILFISTLPFGLYTEGDNLRKIDRDFILQDELTATIAPVQADFQGAGSPILLFHGRKGQIVGIDVFDEHADNYNILVAASTGSGKCRTDGQILMETGFCDLREIQEGDRVLSDNNGAIDTKPVLKTFNFKGEKTVRVKTKFGRVIQCTPDHRLKAENATWVHAEDLKEGDILPVRLSCMRFGEWGDEGLGYLFGVLYADGTWNSAFQGKCNIFITNSNKAVIDKVASTVSSLGFNAYRDKKGLRLEKGFTDYLKAVGITAELSHTKKLPSFITVNASRSFWIGFISGMLDTDTHVNKKNQIELSLASKKLIEQIRTVLEQGFGIVCNLRRKTPSYNGKQCHDAYILTVGGMSARKFAETFKSLKPEKQERLNRILDVEPNDNIDLLPTRYTKLFIDDLIDLHKGTEYYDGHNRVIYLKDGSKFAFTNYRDGKRRLSRKHALEIIRNSYLQNDTLKEWQNFISTHYFDEVVSVEPAENADVYDVAVESTHNYFADGQINHNSFLVNYIVFNYFAAGDKIRIIDIGGSYKKLAHLFDGRFLEFSQDSNIVINPFTNIKNINDELAVLAAIIKQMILSSTGQISVDIAETADTIIKNVIRLAWEEKGNKAGIDDVYFFLRNYRDYVGDVPNRELFINTASMLAFNLTDFTTQGNYGRWFNGRSNFNISSDEFVVLELEHLKPQKELFKVVTLQIINAVTRDLYLSDRNRRKLIIFDEAWQFLEGSDIFADVIEEGYRRARKYRGSFSVVVQSLLDLKNFGMVGDVIRANSAWKFLLASPDFEKAKMEKIIDYDDFVMRILKTVRSNKPRYSEIFIDSPFGLGVVRLIVDRYTYYIFTSDPKETSEIERIAKTENVSYAEAIQRMVEKYKR